MMLGRLCYVLCGNVADVLKNWGCGCAGEPQTCLTIRVGEQAYKFEFKLTTALLSTCALRAPVLVLLLTCASTCTYHADRAALLVNLNVAASCHEARHLQLWPDSDAWPEHKHFASFKAPESPQKTPLKRENDHAPFTPFFRLAVGPACHPKSSQKEPFLSPLVLC